MTAAVRVFLRNFKLFETSKAIIENPKTGVDSVMAAAIPVVLGRSACRRWCSPCGVNNGPVNRISRQPARPHSAAAPVDIKESMRNVFKDGLAVRLRQIRSVFPYPEEKRSRNQQNTGKARSSL